VFLGSLKSKNFQALDVRSFRGAIYDGTPKRVFHLEATGLDTFTDPVGMDHLDDVALNCYFVTGRAAGSSTAIAFGGASTLASLPLAVVGVTARISAVPVAVLRMGNSEFDLKAARVVNFKNVGRGCHSQPGRNTSGEPKKPVAMKR